MSPDSFVTYVPDRSSALATPAQAVSFSPAPAGIIKNTPHVPVLIAMLLRRKENEQDTPRLVICPAICLYLLRFRLRPSRSLLTAYKMMKQFVKKRAREEPRQEEPVHSQLCGYRLDLILYVQFYVGHSRAFDGNVPPGQFPAISPWFVLPIEKADLVDSGQLILP